MDTEQLQAAIPLCATLGIRSVGVTTDRVELAMDWAPERTTTGGAMHGGALMALADSAGAVVAFVNLPDGASGTTTVTSSTNFIGAVRAGVVTAVSRVLHAGSTTIAVNTEVRDASGKLIVVTNQVQLVLRPR